VFLIQQEYQRIENLFKNLIDNDIGTAFILMRDSSILMTNFEEEINRVNKELEIMKIKINSIENRMSYTYDPKTVAKGDRQKEFNPRVKRVRIALVNKKDDLNDLQKQYNFLARVNFKTQMMYEKLSGVIN
jgi:hypothetical protein